jgi:Protein of unknown function (DUF742)
MVRPYTMTGGRSGLEMPEVALEALIAATPLGMRLRHRFRWESAEIVTLSRQEVAVIELAALLDVPVGVVRVLVVDLRKKGAVTITDPPDLTGDGDSYTDLLTKVLDGIKSL